MSKESLNKREKLRNINTFVNWLFWDFSGLRFIYEKIRPPVSSSTEKRPPATFLLWFIGIYVALFGVASQRYENRVNTIENLKSTVLTLIVNNKTRKNAMRRLPEVQKMLCPRKPEFLNPIVTLESLFGAGKFHKETVDIVKASIEDFKFDLSAVNLEGVDLQGADLKGADFHGANLRNSNLQKADLRQANFQKADLLGANLQKATLSKANLKDAFLMGVNLYKANLWETDLRRAMLGTIGLNPVSGFTIKGGTPANLREAKLNGAKFQEANLIEANFKDATLVGASFELAILYKANLEGAQFGDLLVLEDKDYRSMKGYSYKLENKFKGAVFEYANLNQTTGLDIEHLSEAKTLYGAKLDADLKWNLQGKYPNLLNDVVSWDWEYEALVKHQMEEGYSQYR